MGTRLFLLGRNVFKIISFISYYIKISHSGSLDHLLGENSELCLATFSLFSYML